MRMGIFLGRFPMGCPPGMSDAAGSRHCHSSVCFLYQDFQTSLGFYNLCLTGPVISHCDSRRIISSVLQLRQPAKQNRSRLLFTYISYNSTHNILSIIFIFKIYPGVSSPLQSHFKRVYSTMYFKICHYEILIIILSLPQKLTFFQEYATLSVQKQNEENYI